MVNSQSVQWDQRCKWNCFTYIIIYGLLGAVTGITNNAMLSYYDIVAPNLVTGLNIYSAISSILLAVVILSIHRWGYKKILLIAPPVTIISLIATIVTHNQAIIIIAYIVSSVSIGIYDMVYPLMFTVYVPRKIRTKLFTTVMSTNLITQSILTFLGGKMVVWFFAKLQHLTYLTASHLSGNQNSMHGTILANYTQAYRLVILVAVLFNVIAFFIAFFLKEKPEDYRDTDVDTPESKLDSFRNMKQILSNKTIIMWIVYLSLIQFGASLVTPYFPIYLNNYLHIDRGVTATINTLQTASMFIGYMVAPFLEKKLGAIVSIASTTLACIPLMILMANGRSFGTGAVLAVVIGTILFLRSGIANASMPIQQELQMIFVDKDLRPAFSSLLTLISAGVGIINGLFTQFYLLKTMAGYAHGYYIAAVLYVIGAILLLTFFKKKYNHSMENSSEEN